MPSDRPSRFVPRALRAVAAIALIAAVATAAWMAAARAQPVLRHPRVLLELWRQQPAARLPVPVEGVTARDLRDTWGAPRSGGRSHEGIDIFARRGTPVLSTTRGIVARVGVNRLGGNVVTVLGPGLELHYYAHLDAHRAFAEGDVVAAGDVLGFVGDTGNARGTPPHLHYGIHAAGGPTNPHPRLALNAKPPAGEPGRRKKN